MFFFITQDPIDLDINRKITSKYVESDHRSTNCSLLVSDILEINGKLITKSISI